jgi:hypothetical protein
LFYYVMEPADDACPIAGRTSSASPTPALPNTTSAPAVLSPFLSASPSRNPSALEPSENHAPYWTIPSQRRSAAAGDRFSDPESHPKPREPDCTASFSISKPTDTANKSRFSEGRQHR